MTSSDITYDFAKIFDNHGFEMLRTKAKSYTDKKKLTTALKPLIDLVRPDIWFVHDLREKPGNSVVIIQNINLKFQTDNLLPELMSSLNQEDIKFHAIIDKVFADFVCENQLQPFEAVLKVLGRAIFADNIERKIMRTAAFLINDEKTGFPTHTFVYCHDLTNIVTNSKPNNYQITLTEEKKNLIPVFEDAINSVLKDTALLTNREIEVLKLICKGDSSKIIADQLCISKATVDTHRQRLLVKLGVPNTAALIQKGIEKGII